MLEFFKDLGKAFTIGVIIFLIRGLIMYLNGFEIEMDENFYLDFAYNQMYAVVLYMANAHVLSYLLRRFKNRIFEIRNLLLAASASVLISVVAIFIMRLFIKVIIYDMPLAEFIGAEKLMHYWFSLTISITVTTAFYIFYYYRSKQENKVKEQKVIAGTASAKFNALKNQLDPHFLFNSLNVLTSLIEEHPENAQRFTTGLSKVYRYVLEQKNKDLVTVDEELQFAKTYMSLLKMRFEDSIVFEIPEQSMNPESKVVPLSLQLLLENAVKHNIVTSNKPLHIRIYEDNGILIVENNLQAKQVIKKSSGVGLSNIRQRYQLLTNKQVSVNEDGTHFKVAVPMLTKQIKVMRQQQEEKEFDDTYIRARKHVEELKGFYYNLISYCLVIPFLIFINYRTYWEFKWFWFSAIGWGVGLAFHAYKVFVNDGVLGRDWERRKIQKFMEEEKGKPWD